MQSVFYAGQQLERHIPSRHGFENENILKANVVVIFVPEQTNSMPDKRYRW